MVKLMIEKIDSKQMNGANGAWTRLDVYANGKLHTCGDNVPSKYNYGQWKAGMTIEVEVVEKKTDKGTYLNIIAPLTESKKKFYEQLDRIESKLDQLISRTF